MEEYVLAAIGKGLQSMTFLEHLECGINYDIRTWLTPEHFSQYFQQGQHLQQRYKDKIHIRLGVEVGYNPHAVDELQQMLSKFPFEHVGLSYHFLGTTKKHLNLFSRRPDKIQAVRNAGPEHILTEYFSGLIAACQTIRCDKICHLDAALRFLPEISLSPYNHQQVDQLLTLMQLKQIALEINTSGFFIRSSPFPTPEIILKAKKLGLSLIPGSDAHKPQDIARGFDQIPHIHS